MADSPDVKPYVDLTLFDRDAQDIFDTALAVAETEFPDWVPREGNTEVVLLEGLALEASELTFAINRLPGAITEVLLRLFEVERDEGQRATAEVEFTVSDTLGHEIPPGTRVRATFTDGTDPVEFTTDAGLVITAGSSTGTVAVTATEVGTAAHLATVGQRLEILDAIIFLERAEFSIAPTGGTEPETGAEFLDRGVQTLRRLVATLVLPHHFTAYALDDPQIHRALTIDNYDPGQGNELQTVSNGGATAGTFTLTFTEADPDEITGDVAWDATASAIRAALEALASIEPGDVRVTGGPLNTADVVVEFTGAYAAQDLALMTADSTNLTGGPAAVTATQDGGVEAPGDHPGHVTTAVLGEDGVRVSDADRAALETEMDDASLANLLVHVVEPTVTVVDITVTVVRFDGYTDQQVIDAIDAELSGYLTTDDWPWDGTVRRNELIARIDRAEGVDYVDTLAEPAADVALPGVAPLAEMGALAVMVQAP